MSKPFFTGLMLALVATVASAAPPSNISQSVAVCDPFYPNRCMAPAANGSIVISGTATSAATATAAAPAYVEGTANPFSQTLTGLLRTTLTTALPAGSAIIGNFRVDQTTPGTTNGVVINSGTVAATQSGTWTTQIGGNSFTNIATNTDTIVKNSAGTFAGLIVNTIGNTSSATVYNNTTCTGAKIGTFSTILQTSLQINATAGTGICVTTTGVGAADITVLWR